MKITKEFSDRCRSFTLECSTDVPDHVILVNISHKPGKHHVYIHGAEKRDLNPGVSYSYSPLTDFNFRVAHEVPNKRFSKIILEAYVDTVSRVLARASDENFIDLSCPIVAGFHAVIRDLIRRTVIC